MITARSKKAMGIAALAALGCMFFGTVGAAALSENVFGLVERCSTYSAALFTAIRAVRVSRISYVG